MNTDILLPRGYLSYSAYTTWKTNKDAYRKRYYEGGKPFETPETRFGKQMAEAMENDHIDFRHVPHFSVTELPIEVEIEGVKVYGKLDSFDPDTLQFLDHKTGHADKNGNPPWDRVKVAKHGQLPWYSMMIKEKYGNVHDTCLLVWLETEVKKPYIEYKGHKLGLNKEINLTGRIETFERVIEEWEREKIKKDLLVVAREISEDYKKFINKNI